MKEKKTISTRAARLPSPGRETWGPKRTGNEEYFSRCIQLLSEERAKNPGYAVSMNINHTLGQVSFSYQERDLAWESLIKRANNIMNKARLDELKRFFNKR
jgi:hypothetical protein